MITGAGVASRACGEMTCDPCALVDVTITPGTGDVAKMMLPWAFVELVMMLATALAAAAGTAVAAWLFKPGTGRRAALFEFPSCEEGEFAAGGFEAALLSLGAWLGACSALGLPFCGEAGFAAGDFEAPALSFAAWFGEVPALGFAFSGAGFDAGALDPALLPPGD